MHAADLGLNLAPPEHHQWRASSNQECAPLKQKQITIKETIVYINNDFNSALKLKNET